MIDLLPSFDWTFWTVEKSAVVRNFSLIGTGLIGLVFLVWRAVSNDRSARAALQQAATSTRQLELLNRQLELSTQQTSALVKQAEIAEKNHTQNIAQKYAEMLSDAIRTLSQSNSILERATSLLIMQEIASKNANSVNIVTNAIETFLSTQFPSHPLSLKGFRLIHSSGSIMDNAKALCSLPDAVWLDFQTIHSSYFDNPSDIKLKLQSIIESSTGDESLDEETKWIITQISINWLSRKPYMRSHMIYKHSITSDRIQAIKTLERLKKQYSWASCVCMKTDMNGLYLAGANLASFAISGSAFRGAYFYECDLSNTSCYVTDFSETDFVGTSFKGANLTHCNFKRANLKDVDFEYAIIDHADFRDCQGIDPNQFKNAASCRGAIFTDDDIPAALRLTGVGFKPGIDNVMNTSNA